MSLQVSAVMTADVFTVRPDTTYSEIVNLVEGKGVSALPVVDRDGSVLGIVSEGDLIMKVMYPGTARVNEWRSMLATTWRSLSDEKWEAVRTDLQRAAGLTAQEVMTAPAVTIEPEASIAKAASLMHTRDIKRLPVVDKAGRLVGIVSRVDLLKPFVRSDAVLEQDVHELLAPAIPIGVSVEAGVVTLDGTVPEAEHDRIVPLVSVLPGVVGVVDHLHSSDWQS